MIDADDWAKEDCVCGHVRYAHKAGTGECSRTRIVTEKPADLPPANDDDPFSWPANWPPHDTWPRVEKPCDCKRFDYPEWDGQ